MKIQHSWKATPWRIVNLQAFQKHYAPENKKLKISSCFSNQTFTNNTHLYVIQLNRTQKLSTQTHCWWFWSSAMIPRETQASQLMEEYKLQC